MTQEIRDWLKENPAVKEIMEGGKQAGQSVSHGRSTGAGQCLFC